MTSDDGCSCESLAEIWNHEEPWWGNPLPPEEQVERDMAPENLLIHGHTDDDGKPEVHD